MSTAPAADRPQGNAFWRAIFGNDAPVEIEIGSGDGTFLLTRAVAAPRGNLLGIERAPRKAERLAARVARLGLANVRTLGADATCVLAMVPAASLGAYHVYFPDPWPKRRHARRRIFSPAFVRLVARTLVDGGELSVATDVGDYMATIDAVIRESGEFAALPFGDDHPGLDTAFARKYRAEGRTLFLGRFARLPRAASETDGADLGRGGVDATGARLRRGTADGGAGARTPLRSAPDEDQPGRDAAASKIRSS
ncbi:MAG: hypothetical protein E6J72_21125 [Deltaproteobacteria bacterium]|nr:MAG: hypothetical protein E6J72_21125 [Deltaproteobacteria bacterium]